MSKQVKLCPYNYKKVRTLTNWNENPINEETEVKTGATLSTTEHEYMQCVEEKCGAWHNGKCNYRN